MPTKQEPRQLPKNMGVVGVLMSSIFHGFLIQIIMI